MANIFVSPLSWGLGHATRDIPIIRELIHHGHNVTVATSGRALILLTALVYIRIRPLFLYIAPAAFQCSLLH